jgi:hypothetical protein
LYSIPDLIGSKFADDAENQSTVPESQPAVLEGRSLAAEDDDADVYADYDEITKRPTKFVRQPTHLDANNAIAGVSMESDPLTVNELLNYVLKIQEAMLAIEAESGWEDVIPSMQNIPVALSCDGVQAYALLRIKRPETVPFTIISGGFHLLLSAYKANGKLFAFSHLRDFFSLQRTNDKQLDWVMEPGVPKHV